MVCQYCENQDHQSDCTLWRAHFLRSLHLKDIFARTLLISSSRYSEVNPALYCLLGSSEAIREEKMLKLLLAVSEKQDRTDPAPNLKPHIALTHPCSLQELRPGQVLFKVSQRALRQKLNFVRTLCQSRSHLLTPAINHCFIALRGTFSISVHMSGTGRYLVSSRIYLLIHAQSQFTHL